ncbi:MAG: cyclic nucleotide-binding domain-containing protein [Bacteroidetes bacterium]|nr:cyclic nucleotide-binding domain-containing protein [Bacteroidota bacterium]
MDETSSDSKLWSHIWDVLIALAATAAAYYIPLTEVSGFMGTGSASTVEGLLTVLFGLDFAVRLRRRHKLPAAKQRGARFGLALDLLASIPFFLLPGSELLRLLRLLKLYRVGQGMGRLGHLHIVHGTVLRLTFFLYWLALGLHWIACGWIELIGGAPPGATQAAYVDALYWTTSTITTVGYGDIVPVTPGQKVYGIGVMMLGVGIYAYLIGNIASLISSLDPVRARYMQQRERLSAFMQYRALPTPLRRRIQRYFDYVWEERLVSDESEVMQSLPPSLREEVALFLKRDLIKNVPLFDAASDAFVRDVALNLESFVALPGDFVVRVGETGREMYFLSRGTVEVVAGDGTIMNTLSDGDFFGEIALFLDQPRTASVRAVTACDLYELDKRMFERIVSTYPDVADTLEAEAKLRYGVDIELSED